MEIGQYGGGQATATKHRGYDLKWRLGSSVTAGNPSALVLKFEPQPSCLPMGNITWGLCAIEYLGTGEGEGINNKSLLVFW